MSTLSFPGQRPALRLCAAALAGLALQLAAAEPAPGPIPVELLLRPRAVNEAKLSPDGKHLGAVSSDQEGARSLLVLDLATGKTEVFASPAEVDVGTLHWLNGQELIFTSGADQRYSYSLFRGRLGQLANAIRFNAHDFTSIIGLPRDRPNRALVWIVVSGRPREFDSPMTEMATNIRAADRMAGLPRTTLIKTINPPKDGVVVDWLALENGELGYCITYKDRKNTLHRYDSSHDSWVTVDLDLDRCRVAGMDPDLHNVWVSHFEPAQGFLLQRFDPATGAFAEPVWRDAAYDPGRGQLHFSRKTKQLVAVGYDQRRRFTKCLQEPFASAQKLMQQKFPAADVTLLNFDDADTKLLYDVSSAQDPGRTVLLDLTHGSMEILSEVAPWLQGRAFQATYPMSYKTADGLKEEGYVTLPAGASAAHKVPLVVLVHNGPWSRDRGAFNPIVQFLASRGYAVLQPNYRGSTGYIPAVSFDGRFEFKKMHEDVTAAARAGAALEMIDGQRLAIMGEGFGGYLALIGAGLEPGLYRSAVSIEGTLDWEQFVRDLGEYPATRGDYEQLRDFLGKPGKDRDAFAEYSAIRQGAAIKAAVFLAYDENPNLLSSDQARQLSSLLKKQGTPCETFTLKYGAYDPRALASVYDLYHKLDAFLARNLFAPPAR